MVKNLPVVWENWVQSLAWQDPLEEGMATYFSILAWRNPWTEEPGGHKELDTTERLGEGNGTPLQYSCLETPMDGGAW